MNPDNQFLLIDAETYESVIHDRKSELEAALRTSGMEADHILETFSVYEIVIGRGPIKRNIAFPGNGVSRLKVCV